jgi:hypothetical protein
MAEVYRTGYFLETFMETTQGQSEQAGISTENFDVGRNVGKNPSRYTQRQSHNAPMPHRKNG